MSYTVVDRGTSHLKILLSGVSGGRYDVKVNNVTKSNVAHNATLTFTGLSPNVNYTVYVYKIPRLYRMLVVTNGSTENPLSLAEVEVTDFNNKNVSRRSFYAPNIKRVWQSDTSAGGVAARAVDGNTSGVYWNGSVTHTKSGSSKYWAIEWYNPVSIKMVRIYNRTDCCADRLKGGNLVLRDKNLATVHRKLLVGSKSQAFTFDP